MPGNALFLIKICNHNRTNHTTIIQRWYYFYSHCIEIAEWTALFHLLLVREIKVCPHPHLRPSGSSFNIPGKLNLLADIHRTFLELKVDSFLSTRVLSESLHTWPHYPYPRPTSLSLVICLIIQPLGLQLHPTVIDPLIIVWSVQPLIWPHRSSSHCIYTLIPPVSGWGPTGKEKMNTQLNSLVITSVTNYKDSPSKHSKHNRKTV